MLKWVATIKSNIDKNAELVVEANNIRNLATAINEKSNMAISITTLHNIYWGRCPALSKQVSIVKRYSSLTKLSTTITTSVGFG